MTDKPKVKKAPAKKTAIEAVAEKQEAVVKEAVKTVTATKKGVMKVAAKQ